eukprot:SAG31_NODE_531_length_14413_cov_7.712659_16_plen_179_part_00
MACDCRGAGHQVPPYTQLANESIAAFLLAAGNYSYYGAGSETGIGPEACFGAGGSMRIPTWPDMHRPLGAPQGELKNSSVPSGGWLFTRVFASGTSMTRVALNDSWSCIWWGDGFVTGRDCPPHGSAAMHEIFASWGRGRMAPAAAVVVHKPTEAQSPWTEADGAVRVSLGHTARGQT